MVHRPAAGSAAKQVALTATVRLGAATGKKTLTATVPALPAAAPLKGYAFAYFTGDSVAGEKIYFAASQGNNALRWTELNGGQPALTSTLGTKGLRDPFLIRSPEGDKFFLIATDLSIGGGTSWDDSQRKGSRYIEVWESTDLVQLGPAAARAGLAADRRQHLGARGVLGRRARRSTSSSGRRSSTPSPTRATPATRTTGCSTPPRATSSPSAPREDLAGPAARPGSTAR